MHEMGLLDDALNVRALLIAAGNNNTNNNRTERSGLFVAHPHRCGRFLVVIIACHTDLTNDSGLYWWSYSVSTNTLGKFA